MNIKNIVWKSNDIFYLSLKGSSAPIYSALLNQIHENWSQNTYLAFWYHIKCFWSHQILFANCTHQTHWIWFQSTSQAICIHQTYWICSHQTLSVIWIHHKFTWSHFIISHTAKKFIFDIIKLFKQLKIINLDLNELF